MESNEFIKIYQSAFFVVSVLLFLGCKEAETESEEPGYPVQRSEQRVSSGQSPPIMAPNGNAADHPPLTKVLLSLPTKKSRPLERKERLPKEDKSASDAGATASQPSFMDNSDGTVTDDNTELMWQQQDDNFIRTWVDAGVYCETTLNDGSGPGGWNDWRLPNKKELASIIHSQTSSPAIDHKAFPGTNPATYWSSATSLYNTSLAWGVYFGSGYSNKNYKTNKYYVRCVRSE